MNGRYQLKSNKSFRYNDSNFCIHKKSHFILTYGWKESNIELQIIANQSESPLVHKTFHISLFLMLKLVKCELCNGNWTNLIT